MGSLLVTFAVLAAALLVFHGWLLRRPRPRWFWLSVDYVWFFAIAFGLVGSTATVRNLITAEQYHEQLQHLDYLHRLAQDRAAETAFELSLMARLEAAEEAPHYREAAEWFRRLRQLLHAGYDPEQWENFRRADGAAKADDPLAVKDRKAEALEALAELQAEEDKLAHMTSSREPSAFENGVTLVVPWIVAFALALRVTRVTAEILDTRKTEPRP
jgi:hypothetical protein